MEKIPLIKPHITDAVKQRVNDVLDSGYLTEGPVTREFENKFAEFINAKHAIAFTSCTTGLEVALRALNIGEGDEVIVPDYTYPATAAVMPIVGATAVIVDVDPHSMLINYDKIEEAITDKTKAIMPVSIFGNPLDYDRLNLIREKYNLKIIEDAACSIGAEYKGVKVGTQADIAVFSLHPRKFITTGEGGMLTTNDDKLAEWMNSYKHFGMDMSGASREGIQFSIIGTNYKLSNILSAVGLEQMNIIDDLLSRRRELACNYAGLLEKYDSVQLPGIVEGGLHSYQSYCVFVENRDEIMQKMREENIEVQIGTYSLHMHKAFNSGGKVRLHGSFEGSIRAFKECLTLPLYHELTIEQQEYIVNKLSKYLK